MTTATHTHMLQPAWKDRLKLRPRTYVLLTLALLLGLSMPIWNYVAPFLVTSGSRQSAPDGSVSSTALNDARRILGASFSEQPSFLYYLCVPWQEPYGSECGSYDAIVKAKVSHEEFDRLARNMRLLPKSRFGIGNPLDGCAWGFLDSPEKNPSWWDPKFDPSAEEFGSELGEAGTRFMKYESGWLYYEAHVLKWQ